MKNKPAQRPALGNKPAPPKPPNAKRPARPAASAGSDRSKQVQSFLKKYSAGAR